MCKSQSYILLIHLNTIRLIKNQKKLNSIIFQNIDSILLFDLLKSINLENITIIYLQGVNFNQNSNLFFLNELTLFYNLIQLELNIRTRSALQMNLINLSSG